MSKNNTEAAEAAEKQQVEAMEAEAPTAEPVKQDSRVWCGPSVRGVARQNTIYTGELPEALKEFIGKHPAAAGLVVGLDAFAATRRSVETAGTAESYLFGKIKSEL